ncbi:MAG: hypothetical protein GX663_04640 [Clostridiales bacterium]|nr:hypothetical protein [Clostridiales bacterium]
MFTIFVTYIAKDKITAENFYKEVEKSGIIDASRAEEGNISYDYYLPADVDNELFLLERWVDKSAQAHHATLGHFIKLSEIKSRYDVKTIIKYE